MVKPVKPIEWENDKVKILDQRELPHREVYLTIYTPFQMAGAINSLAIRGAPLLGLAGAWGIFLGINKINESDRETFFKELFATRELLLATRPTAINLAVAIDRAIAPAVSKAKTSVAELKQAIYNEIKKMEEEAKTECQTIGEVGAKLIKDGSKVLTHCNTGFLATGGIGTALAALYTAKEQGKDFTVIVDETRPLLQGARLTSWELQKAGIPVKVLPDSAAASLLISPPIKSVVNVKHLMTHFFRYKQFQYFYVLEL